MQNTFALPVTSGQRQVSGAELALYRAYPGDPTVEVRFAHHVLSCYPDDVWALTALAKHTPDDATFERQIRHAVKVGLHGLLARTGAGEEITSDDYHAEATLIAMVVYGSHLALRGRLDEATTLLKTMLDLDPNDAVGAIAMMERQGVIHPAPQQRRVN